MRMNSSAPDLLTLLKRIYPDAPSPNGIRSEMLEYQRLALYGLALRWNVKKARILEIGTAQGASAFMLSKAAPRAQIITVNPNFVEAQRAFGNLKQAGCDNVTVVSLHSAEYLTESEGQKWHMIFVDGDHKAILQDMVWWNNLVPGGLFLCHDYSPVDAGNPCPPVYATLNNWRDKLGRDFDVKIVDEGKTGMAGWYKREGEVWLS